MRKKLVILFLVLGMTGTVSAESGFGSGCELGYHQNESSSPMEDYCGTAQDGTWNGDISTASAFFNKGYDLEYSDGTDDYVDIGDVGAAEPSGNFTFTLRAYPRECYDFMRWWDKSPKGNYAGGGYRIIQTCSSIVFNLGTADGSDQKGVKWNYGGTVNTWYNTTVRYRADTNNLTIRVNGDHKNSTIMSAGADTSSTVALWLGKSATAGNPYNGKFDDFRLYNQYLSDAEVKSWEETNNLQTNNEPSIDSTDTDPDVWKQGDTISGEVNTTDPDNNVDYVQATVTENGTQIVQQNLTDGDNDGVYDTADLFTVDQNVPYNLTIKAVDTEGAQDSVFIAQSLATYQDGFEDYKAGLSLYDPDQVQQPYEASGSSYYVNDTTVYEGSQSVWSGDKDGNHGIYHDGSSYPRFDAYSYQNISVRVQDDSDGKTGRSGIWLSDSDPGNGVSATIGDNLMIGRHAGNGSGTIFEIASDTSFTAKEGEWYNLVFQRVRNPVEKTVTMKAWVFNSTGHKKGFVQGTHERFIDAKDVGVTSWNSTTFDNLGTAAGAPEISSITTTPSTWELGDNVDVAAAVSDPDNVTSVNATVYEDGTQIQKVELTDGDNDGVYDRLDVFKVDKSVTYKIVVEASDTTGARSSKSVQQLVDIDPSVSLDSPADSSTFDLTDSINYRVEATGETGSVEVVTNGSVLSLPKTSRGTSTLSKSKKQMKSGQFFWRAYTAFDTTVNENAEEGNTNSWNAVGSDTSTTDWTVTQKEVINGSYSYNNTDTGDSSPLYDFPSHDNKSISLRMKYASHTKNAYAEIGLNMDSGINSELRARVTKNGAVEIEDAGGTHTVKPAGWFDKSREHVFKFVPRPANKEMDIYIDHQKVYTSSNIDSYGSVNELILTVQGDDSASTESVLYDDIKLTDTAASSNYRHFTVRKDPDLVTFNHQFPERSPPLDWTFLPGKSDNATYSYMIQGDTQAKGYALYQERESTADTWTQMYNQTVDSVGKFNDPRDLAVLSENESETYLVPSSVGGREHTVKVLDIIDSNTVVLELDGVNIGRIKEGSNYFVRDTRFERSHFNSLVEKVDFKDNEVVIAIDSTQTKRIGNKIGYYDYRTSFRTGGVWYNSSRVRVAVGQLPFFELPQPTGTVKVTPNQAGYSQELQTQITVRGIKVKDATFYYRHPNGTEFKSNNFGDVNENTIYNITSFTEFKDLGQYEWWVQFEDMESNSLHESPEFQFTLEEDTSDLDQQFSEEVDTTGDGTHDTTATVYYDVDKPKGVVSLRNFTTGTIPFKYRLGVENIEPEKRFILKDPDGNIVLNRVHPAAQSNFDFPIDGKALSSGEWEAGQYTFYSVLEGDNYNLKTKETTFRVKKKKSAADDLIENIWVAGFWGKYLDAFAKTSSFSQASWNFFFQVLFFLGLFFGVSYVAGISFGTILTFTTGFILAAGSYLEPWLGGFFLVSPAVYLGVWIFLR